MGLLKYKQKRNFKESPEPTGGRSETGKLRFVIQKHHASHLHYDFRLEMEGVLKSWAVPKGPSTDPRVKRLAMMVEDHPYDYRNFEGIIPSGYGAGTVIIWDEGFYEPAYTESADKKTQDKELRRQLHAGKITFVLHGKKLKGEYALIKANGRGENAWLLFKVKDKYASEKDITLKDKSVVSKKTLEQVKKASSNFYGTKPAKQATVKSDKAKKVNKRKVLKKTVSKNKGVKVSDVKQAKILKRAVKKKVGTPLINHPIYKKAPEDKFSMNIRPMLATLVDKPFNNQDWLYEIKMDGYRALAFMNKGKVELKSRNDKSFNDKFYPIISELKSWNINAIVDGEVVVVNKNGISNFGALQNWRSEADGELLYYVFDLIWLEGKDLSELPLIERRTLLESILPGSAIIRMSAAFEGSGMDVFDAAKKIGIEGIIAKKKNSFYQQGSRTKEWLKIKANKRQEVVIGGYTKNDDSSKAFSALLVGVFDGKKLVYTGKIGTGFNNKTQTELLNRFKSLIIKESPFTTLPDINKPSRFRPDPPHATATWLKPELVCEVSFAELTADGIMRHPSFEGIRIDKAAKDVVLEKERSTPEVVKDTILTEHKLIIPAAAKTRKTFLNPTDETQVREVNGNKIKFTNLSKIFWPKEKITKRDVINYYYQIAPYILPYLKDRPQSMNRHPNGINGMSFYYKDVTGKAPDWIETYRYHSDADDRIRNYLVAKDEASLLYMASLGCIEMNPWSSRVISEEYPDWCIIDLDPARNTFDQVIEAALVAKGILDSFGLASYPKTSGSTGMHIYIPLGAKYTYEQSKEFARLLAKLIHYEIPAFTSIERAVKDRKGKMYIDFLQNRPHATVAAPYSLRPRPGAPVSMPLHWDEIKKGLKITDFNIFNAVERVKQEGDIFKYVLGKGVNLDKAMKSLLETL